MALEVDIVPTALASLHGEYQGNESFTTYFINGSAYNGYLGPSRAEVIFITILWTVITPIIFSIIIVLGVIGNSLVLYVIISQPAMRTVTNVLLFNLAASDMTFVVIACPFTAYKYAAPAWGLGEAACKISKYAIHVPVCVTVFTLVAISIVRYMTIAWNTQTSRIRTRTNMVVVCACIWVVVLTINIPLLIYQEVKVKYEYQYCGMHDTAIAPTFITFFIIGYAVPLFIICLTYLLVMCHLSKKKKHSSLDKNSHKSRTGHVARVVLTVIVVFGISWLPNHVQSLVAHFGSLPEGTWYEFFRMLWNCMAYGNSCANPFIYTFVSAEFRKAFHEVICCKAGAGPAAAAAAAAARRQEPNEAAALCEMKTMVTNTNGTHV